MLLSKKIIDLIENAKNFVVRNTNTTMVFTYFSIGKMIVEELQNGNEKAVYGSNLLEFVSNDLKLQLGKGFSVDNLENMRKFYLCYQEQFRISENPSRNLTNLLISEKASRKFPNQFLSCSHYLFLKSTIEYIGEWDTLYNISFNYTEFGVFKNTSSSNNFASKYQTILPSKNQLQDILNHHK